MTAWTTEILRYIALIYHAQGYTMGQVQGVADYTAVIFGKDLPQTECLFDMVQTPRHFRIP